MFATAEKEQQARTVRLRFCPETNDLLYPKEDRQNRRLVYYCKNCGYEENVDPKDYCVHINQVNHTAKEQTVVLQHDVRSDPTLPRTKDVRCPNCNHNEAVYFVQNTVEGMTLYFTCLLCNHQWRDYV